MYRRKQAEETNFWPIVSDFMLGLFLLSVLFLHQEHKRADACRSELEAVRQTADQQRLTYEALRRVTISENNKLAQKTERALFLNEDEQDQKVIAETLGQNVARAVELLQHRGIAYSDMQQFVVAQANKLAAYLPGGQTVTKNCSAAEAKQALAGNIEKALAYIDTPEQAVWNKSQELEKAIRGLAGMFEATSPMAATAEVSELLPVLKEQIQELLTEQEERGKNKGLPIFVISSKEVTFPHNKDTLDERNERIVRKKLDELKRFILENSDKVTDIMFVGFTDQSGEDLPNADLGLRRATAIRRIWDEYVEDQPADERFILRSKEVHNFSAGETEAKIEESKIRQDSAAGAQDRHISIYLIGLEKE